ncbi:hypothetical protein U6A24_09930 [Aquimarina gracilis]|uniref:Uncharacterized protein n=1 Tax=Aquimarina gracilis TaxID=874422 RepID=A0ABU5ZVL1_9FLAO|nr:hypothetical protein [Aquimarina gracilis]MEB3345781.1 hypothetical protein [Aquimarina gracilis]
MAKQLHFFTLLCFFLLVLTVTAKGTIEKNTIDSNSESTKEVEKSIEEDPSITAIKKTALPVRAFRSFKSLDKFDVPEVVSKAVTRKFEEEGYAFNTQDSLKNKKWLDMANNTFATIDETGNYVDLLDEDGLGELPVAIRPQTISNITYTVGVAKAVFKPAYTELTVFLKIDTPKGTLILGGNDIKLSHEGGIVGDAKLALISQFTFNFDSGKVLVTLKGSFEDPATYALIDCSGFKELGIDANIKFANSFLYPVDKEGKERLGYVESGFRTVVGDWNDIVVNISLPEFGIRGLKGTTFRLNTAVFDFSDLRNDPAMPSNYLSKYYNENPDLWRGVYINTLEVVLPKEFSKKNSNKRTAFGATNLIIDSQGITGRFYAENIINIDEGSASKWQFSLDRFLIEIETNSIKAGEFNGEIILPVSKIDRLEYAAIIQPDEYTLQVSSTKDIEFDVWNAQVVLTKESYIEMKVKEGKFRPKANLHGTVNIASGLGKNDSGGAAQSKDKTVDFKGIVFENLLLQTESPKFSVTYFGYRGEMKIANFPLTVNEIGLRTPPGGKTAELLFNFNINLTSTQDGGNGGGSTLLIQAKLDDTGGRDKWKFDGVKLERVFIQMEVAGMELKGAIFIFDDDPTYGKGFAGSVAAKFTKGVQLDVEAKALFGRTSEFRYWFADASVTIPSGIPIFTGFALNSFGGGASNRMKMAGVNNNPNAAFTQIGASTSGVIYEPDQNSGLGLKASVGIITQNSEELFHATVEFGMTFRKSGGLRDIYFKGHGELVAALPSGFFETLKDNLGDIASVGGTIALPASPPSGAMSVDVFIGYDFVNDILHSTSEIYINFGILKGVGPSGRAGWMDLYVAPDEWHILIGTPDDPIGIALNLGILKLETKSYFMAGDGLPGSPPPPAIVAEILGIDASELDYTRDLNALEAGKGLAFGAHLSVTTGDLRFLIFYARFDAGIGFDIMIKDYGDARCKGSTEQIGLNGWYANGQSYAYLQGELGLNFKLFGAKKKIPIIKGGGAVILQARLPNPAWFQGYLGGHYNLLGGLIKGRFRFKIELGEKCEIVGGSVLDGIVVIGDMTPKEGSADVDVFAAPQVAFNLQINKVFEIPDESGDRKYKILLDKFEVTKDGNPIKGEIKWGDKNDVAAFYSHEILPPNSSLKGYIQVHFEEFVNGNWQKILDEGKVAIESKEVNFTTGEAPKTIPEHNIAYMYPIIGQKNFFTKEYNTGYINLKRGQSYLFDAVPGWRKSMAMTSSSGNTITKNFGYNSGKKQLTFSMPQEISTQTDYAVQVLLIPPSDGEIGANVTDTYSNKKLGGDTDSEDDKTGSFEGQSGQDVTGSDVEVKNRKVEGVLVQGEERELLAFEFRTSQYTTFDRKMRAMRESETYYDYFTYPYGLTLSLGIDPIEPFDLPELVGNDYTANVPLVIIKAVPEDNYYKNEIYPLLYQHYPFEGTITVSRDTDKVGVPPLEGVEPQSWYLTYLENGYTSDINVHNPFRYNLTHYYHQDFEDLRYQLVNSESQGASNKYLKLVTEPFPVMRKGKYKTELKYVLPGQVKSGKMHTVKYTNPLYD